MPTSLRRSDHRAGVWSAAGSLLLAVALVAAVMPLWRRAVNTQRQRVQTIYHEAAAAQALLRNSRVTAQALSERQRALPALASSLLPGPDVTIAERALVTLLAGAARTSGVRVTAMNIAGRAREHRLSSSLALGDQARAPEPSSTMRPPHGVLRLVGARMRLESDIRGLVTLLLELQRGPARLRVSGFEITTATATGADSVPERLTADMLIEGLVVTQSVRTGVPSVNRGRP